VKVLVLEDNQKLATLLRQGFEAQGFVADVSRSGDEGHRLAADGNRRSLTLCNSSPGIPPAHQPQIFDRFYRVHQSPAADGVSLGMSLAREIVHAHHGKLLQKERRPVHTCFTLSLPRLLP
jgi:signal transduction histidine kinase